MESIKSLIVAGIIIVVIIAGGVFFYSRTGSSSKVTSAQSASQPVVTQVQTQKANAQQVQGGQSGQQVISTGEQDILVTKTGFSPNNIKIKVGTRIKWINNTGGMVALNSDPYPVHSSYPAMNFGQFTNGSSVELVFDKSGTYKYQNDMNLSQTGLVIVQ